MEEIKTLIELFVEYQIENVIASLLYRPEKVVFMGYKNVMTARRRAAAERLFAMKKMKTEIEYVFTDRYDYGEMTDKLRAIADENEDCVIDITGGKEVMLAAIGEVCSERKLPMIKFDLKYGRHMSVISGVPLRGGDDISLTIPEIVALNGGAVITDGGTDFQWVLSEDFKNDIESMWEICKKNCIQWNRQSMELAACERYGTADENLNVRCAVSGGVRGQNIDLEYGFVQQLVKRGLITHYTNKDGLISLTYKNEQVYRCLTKAGNILELYAYMLLNEIDDNEGGYYNDLDIGVFVDWDGEVHSGSEHIYDTKNEIDLIAMRGITPVFVSCKNGEARKEALYELDTLAEHFGGRYARKVLFATYISPDEDSKKYIEQRARDMNIVIIDGVDKMSREELKRVLRKNVK